MGSKSDLPTMNECVDILKKFGVEILLLGATGADCRF